MSPPQFIYIELPSFRIKNASGQIMRISYAQLGLISAQYQFVRSGIRSSSAASAASPSTASDAVDLSAALLFADGEPDLWTALPGAGDGGSDPHAEENMLLSYFQAFDSPGSYPIVDAMLLRRGEPCTHCAGYFTLAGKQLRPHDGTPSFRAKFTARSDRAYTPVFYVARSLGAAQRAALWAQIGCMRADEPGIVVASRADVPVGQAYYVMPDSPWFAINGQEAMTDAQIAEAIVRQGVMPTYWIGR
ncbi:uncharacterized protein GGS25DRAFT_518050 [Hypoxylon fragiforme]|uniref:uncharacterized protein n=1 Tax=Hypoxylon fragiforme TaxID=63214 RepID=UPI0020C60680|nr:uncharacterized protein GGS25DRAFT_518050 [Hypoxylon fragiforme]KAI2612357.1 hypothetical protein GGS25DRAFT_518050 [Hypoxylon fragiforme]